MKRILAALTALTVTFTLAAPAHATVPESWITTTWNSAYHRHWNQANGTNDISIVHNSRGWIENRWFEGPCDHLGYCTYVKLWDLYSNTTDPPFHHTVEDFTATFGIWDSWTDSWVVPKYAHVTVENMDSLGYGGRSKRHDGVCGGSHPRCTMGLWSTPQSAVYLQWDRTGIGSAYGPTWHSSAAWWIQFPDGTVANNTELSNYLRLYG